MELKKIIYIIKALGINGILRTLSNSLQRDRIEKGFSPKPTIIKASIPGEYQRDTIISGITRVEYKNAAVQLTFFSQKLIRVSWEPGKQPIPYTLEQTEWEIQHPDKKTDENYISLNCGNLYVTIGKTGEICFKDSHLNILRFDNPPVHREESWQLTTALKPDEHIYGLGERAAPLNLRPGSYCSWNTDVKGSYSTGTDPLYIGSPVYLSISSIGCYLTYYENSYKSYYRIGENLESTFNGGMLSYYIIFGTLHEIYEQFSELVGKSCLPPRWALGYHQCRWGYQSEKDIRKVISGFKDHNLPISAIHLDIDYMDGFRLFTVDPKRFTDMKHLTKELDEEGIKVVATTNPAVKHDRNYNVYSEGLNKDLYCKLPNGNLTGGVSWPGWSVFPDFSKPETRQWWSEQYQFLINQGVTGIWLDMNEPSSFSAWGDMTLPGATVHSMEGQGGNHHEFHNLYGLLMARACYEGLRKNSPNNRPWIFSRSGWTGLQRYAWNWTGDVETSWKSLQQTIPTILGLGLSGHAFSGVDIGGFSGNPNAELYLRWFQMSTFLPLFRTHSAIGTKPREPWIFGDPTTRIIRNFLQLRYRMMPYLYSLAWDTSQTGFPAVRPLFWENPEDPSLWDIADEFLLGKALLIAPVLTEGALTRRIILPSGEWYSLWNDQNTQGPNQIELEVSQNTIPVFVKGGTIFPMEEDGKYNLHIYPNKIGSSSSHIYSDAGDGYGPWRIDRFRLESRPNSMTLIWEKEGNYAFLNSVMKWIVHGKMPTQASIDNEKIAIHDNTLLTPFFNKLEIRFD